ncbi:MAG: LysM peptidoglycan-binding domain-containing protein [Pseudomonadota bacterium]|nr:LysM peptidoglycan-binding domain-containing protein [Pseudomonadota bacterium]
MLLVAAAILALALLGIWMGWSVWKANDYPALSEAADNPPPASAESEAAVTEQAIGALSAERDQLKASLEASQQEAATAARELAQAQERIAGLEQALQEAQAAPDHSAELDSAQAQAQEAQVRVGELESALAQAQAQNAELSERLAAAEAQARTAARAREEAAASTAYTVQEGDTLRLIAERFYGTREAWNVIYRANRERLPGPDVIRPGTRLVIPQRP